MISFIVCILIIYMGKRSKNLRNTGRVFVDANDKIAALRMYLDCKINHRAKLIWQQNIRHERNPR